MGTRPVRNVQKNLWVAQMGGYLHLVEVVVVGKGLVVVVIRVVGGEVVVMREVGEIKIVVMGGVEAEVGVVSVGQVVIVAV